VRVGYFINNEYTEPELRENPPAQPQFDKVSIRCMFQHIRYERWLRDILFERFVGMRYLYYVVPQSTAGVSNLLVVLYCDEVL
jgi:hypothetical protein